MAAELRVSSMTIRRDLNAMSDDGLITLQHGGATVGCLAPLLKGKKNIIITTHSLLAIKIPVILCFRQNLLHQRVQIAAFHSYF